MPLLLLSCRAVGLDEAGNVDAAVLRIGCIERRAGSKIVGGEMSLLIMQEVFLGHFAAMKTCQRGQFSC